MISFEKWWSQKGSSMKPKPNEDNEEFAYRITKEAWKAAKRSSLKAEAIQIKNEYENNPEIKELSSCPGDIIDY